jgi:hypothetical protein
MMRWGWCGVAVPYQGRGQPRRYCSAEHSTSAKRAREEERRRDWYRAVASGAVVNPLISPAGAANYLDVLAMLEWLL